jgi:hypothetical protein
MSTIHILTGILAGKDLTESSAEQMAAFARSERTRLERISLYGAKLSDLTFRGVTFSECGFAKAVFKNIKFRRCQFQIVDLTRTSFVHCQFSDCEFVDSDPYYVSFPESEIDPSSFGKCYSKTTDWNKALILFSTLRALHQSEGDSRGARIAEYYFRIWERRRLYLRWRKTEFSGPLPYFWSLFQGALTGYGERPAYLAVWILAVITFWAAFYSWFFPSVVQPSLHGFHAYWYFSFRVLFGQGFSAGDTSTSLILPEVLEFGSGLVLVSLLIGSISRKLSA